MSKRQPYRRKRADNGAPMEWLVKSLNLQTDECIYWPFGRFGRGDAQIVVDGRSRYVARIVCEKVKGPPPTSKHQAAHGCGNGRDACINHRHIRWATNAENQADRIIHGTSNRGTQNASSVLCKQTVIDIVRRLKKGELQKDIAIKAGVSRQAVGNISTGRNWGWLTGRGQQ